MTDKTFAEKMAAAFLGAAYEKLEAFSVPEPNSGCRLWSKAVDGSGYPVLTLAGRTYTGHRLTALLYYGWPHGRHALHSCDNPRCVAPDHVRWGTAADNNRDKAVRRRVSGTRNPRHKLTPGDVRRVRLEAAAGASVNSLARAHGVDWSTMDDAIRGRTWRHV